MTDRIEDGGPAYTPGPWTVQRGLTGAPYGVSSPNGKVVVTWRGIARPASHEGEANALLLSAAPCLLAALEAIVASLADQDDEGMIEHAEQMIAARAAISRSRQMGVQTGRAAHG